MSERASRADEIVITGSGLVTAAGSGIKPTFEGLCEGRTFIAERPEELWPTAKVAMDELYWPATPQWMDLRKFAGMSARLAIAAAQQALQQAGLEPERSFDPRGSATVVTDPDGSEWEPLLEVIGADDSRPLARRIYEDLVDFHVIRAIPSQVVQLVARLGRMIGPSMSVTRPSFGGLSGLAHAMRLIESGDADRVVLAATAPPRNPREVVAIDRAVSLAPHLKRGGGGAFDRDREGAYLGEGAAALLVERRSAAEQRGARSLGRVLACETRITHTGRSALAAVVDDLGRTGHQPDVIWAHGSASVSGDQQEATMLAQQQPAAVTSSKGSVGSLGGASALTDIVVALHCLDAGRLPPLCLVEEVDPELAPVDWVLEPRSIDHGAIAQINACNERGDGAGAAIIAGEQS